MSSHVEPHWQDGDLTIYHGDCLEIMPELEPVDLILTDPPFNISQERTYISDSRSGKDQKISFDFGGWDYGFNPVPFLEQAKELLVSDGSIIVFASEKQYGVYRQWFEENMYFKQILVWVRINPLPQFNQVSYRNATNLLLWAMKNKNSKDNPNFNFLSQEEMTNVFYAPIVGGAERTEHPTQKPLSIIRKLIKIHCRKNGAVLDPFMGSGTTLKACQELGRKAIGIEIEKKYCDIAIERLRERVLI